MRGPLDSCRFVKQPVYRAERFCGLEAQAAGGRMYHIVLCDDEKEILEELLERVRKCFEARGISARYDGITDARVLMERMRCERIDVLFLDIDMPYYSGMDIAGVLYEQYRDTILVFVTSHDALVYQTFAYRPFGFVRKTHADEELDPLCGRICGELLENTRELAVRKGQELMRVLLKDIVYMEAEGNYLLLRVRASASGDAAACADDGEGLLRIRETMADMEGALSGKGFIRCHKGFLINAAYIERLGSAGVALSDGTRCWQLPVGRSYEKEVRRRVMELLRM